MKRNAGFAILFVLLAPVLFGQENPPAGIRKSSARSSAQPAAPPAAPDKVLMQRIWDGWGTLDPKNVEAFYDKEPGDVFYDITPLKYNGWADYARGTAVLRDLFSSAKFTINDDARVQSSAAGALGTCTIAAELTTTKGQTQNLILRWTVIWANRGGRWLIVHEHVSVPTQ